MTDQLSTIFARWGGLDWAYREQRKGTYLADCWVLEGKDVVIDLDEPSAAEALFLSTAAKAPDDIRALLAIIREQELELHRKQTDLAAARSALEDLWNEWPFRPDTPPLIQARKVLETTEGQLFDQIKAQLILMRRYIIRHGGTMGGECVAWMQLKEYFGVGLREADDEAWMEQHTGQPFKLRPE